MHIHTLSLRSKSNLLFPLSSPETTTLVSFPVPSLLRASLLRFLISRLLLFFLLRREVVRQPWETLQGIRIYGLCRECYTSYRGGERGRKESTSHILTRRTHCLPLFPSISLAVSSVALYALDYPPLQVAGTVFGIRESLPSSSP